MNTGIKSNKDVYLSGSVDSLVKNEYLVENAKGRNSNFEEKDAVDNYQAGRPGDALLGAESFRSSAIFGGVGSKITRAIISSPWSLRTRISIYTRQVP